MSPEDTSPSPQAPCGPDSIPAQMVAGFVSAFEMFGDAGHGMARTIERNFSDGRPPALDPLNLAPALQEVGSASLRNPAWLAERLGNLWADQAGLLGRTALGAMFGTVPDQEKVVESRLRSQKWAENPYTDWLRRAYLLNAEWLLEYVETLDLPDIRTRRKARFAARILADAVSPANFLATNPVALKATFEEGGRNLLRGLQNKLADAAEQGWPPMPGKVDHSAFRFGIDVASTPGKVIWRNDLFELLQYEPSTPRTHATPFLFVPPWINKYYILDLTEKKSMVRWLVSKGHTVFLVSWVNPDSSHAAVGFENYLQEGVLEAIDRVREETAAPRVNIAGYCLGGTLMGTALAWLAARGDERVNSCTFFASQFDFSDSGDLMAVTDSKTVDALGGETRDTGYLPGSKMAGSFDLLRPGDLYWDFAVRRYLLGLDPAAFDLLYWNADSTRMPAKMHDEYLRAFYLENRLARGELRMGDLRLDLAAIGTPTYHLAAAEDHIAPPESVYRGLSAMGGKRRFAHTESGHIAGIINAPAAHKYGFCAGAVRAETDLAEWLAAAPARRAGSWWGDWLRWLNALSGKTVPARKPGARLGVIEDAPGSYVQVRYND